MSSPARASLVLVLAWSIACVGRGTAPSPPDSPASRPTDADAAGAPVADEPAREAPPDAAPPSTPPGVCRADAKHCCQRDGTLVVPGGCQPSYPDHVAPATRRGDDGRCVNIPCHLKCLPADARVQTADGERAIATLTAGELVYTTDCDGRRRLVTIERVSRTPVDATAKILALTLADGRVVRGSPGHPTATGARLDALAAGATLDGSEVVHIQNVPLLGDATYDILPFGPTGTFWADGVLLGSTLAKPSCLVRGDRARAPSRPNH